MDRKNKEGRTMKLWLKMLIGLGLGVIAGFILGPSAQYLKPIGSAFLGLLNMLVVPLVFASMTVGVTSINDMRKLGRVGLKTLILFTVTTAIAIVVGLAFAKLINPGLGLNLSHEMSKVTLEDSTPRISDIILSLIPQNPISAFASGQILQVIVFSILLGLAINLAKEKGRPVAQFLESLSNVMFSLTSMIMKLAPFGIFAIMAWVTGTFGLKVLYPLLKLLCAHYLACIVHMILVFGGILIVMAKLKPMPFFRGMGDAIALAASTTSSNATLPATLHCAQENLGVSKNIAGFIIPLGATVNMNGTAIFHAVAAVFISQAYGIALGIEGLLMIVLTATLSAIGCAGIPGGGLVTLSIVLASVGLPLEGIAIIAGIDRLRDIMGTILNVLGDAVVSVYVAKSEGEFDEKCYNSGKIVSFEHNEAEVSS